MKKRKFIFISIIILLIIYITGCIYFNDRMFFNTTVLGYDISGMNKEEAKEFVKNNIKNDYQIRLTTIDQNQITLTSDDLGIEVLVNDFPEQNLFEYPISFISSDNKNLSYELSFDENKLNETLSNLDICKAENMVEPQNAYISEYKPGVGYEIIPETNGTKIDIDKMSDKLKNAIMNKETELDLSDCYKSAEITKENQELINTLNILNSSINASITYDFGPKQVTVNADTYHAWLTITDNQVSVNKELVNEYVLNLAKETNTAYSTRNFKTTDGRTVEITGPYGYRMNVDAEVEELIKNIEEGTILTREPIYDSGYGGISREGNDYGTTYVEVDLTNQKVYLYVNGELIQSSDCVTGNVSKGYDTPPGIYPLTYKKSPDVLDGPGYSTPVTYWMPFNGGIGLHDATWRSSFGGNIYKTNGSHGCVNLPYDMAKTIYENAFSHMPIICYN